MPQSAVECDGGGGGVKGPETAPPKRCETHAQQPEKEPKRKREEVITVLELGLGGGAGGDICKGGASHI